MHWMARMEPPGEAEVYLRQCEPLKASLQIGTNDFRVAGRIALPQNWTL